MKEFVYLPTYENDAEPNRIGFICKAVKDMLPHELEFQTEIEGLVLGKNTAPSDCIKYNAAVKKLFAHNKTTEPKEPNE
jgi:hypothetical protein